MPALLLFIGGAITRFFADKITYFLAMKLMMIGIVTLILPVIAKNLFVWLAGVLHNVMMSAVSGNEIQSFVIQFSGVGAYLASHLNIPTCFSIIITAVTIRLILNFVPFIR
jgi:hypothetical protein